MFKQSKQIFQIIIVDIFAVSLMTFIIFFLLEDWASGLVTNYVRLEILLLFCLLIGLLAVLFGERQKIKKALRFRWLWALESGGVAILFILPRVSHLDKLGYLISVVGGLGVFFVVLLVNSGHTKTQKT